MRFKTYGSLGKIGRHSSDRGGGALKSQSPMPEEDMAKNVLYTESDST